MNSKTIKRGINVFLIILTLLLILPKTNSLDYTCCFHPSNFCQDVASAQECCGEATCGEGIFDPTTPCAQTQCEWQGCCLQTCEITPYKDCNYAFTFINDLAPTYTCDSAPECGTGCCVYLTSENNIGFCEVKSEMDCSPYELYPDTQFHPGMIEEECNNLCLIGQTVTGTLTGIVSDETTSAQIPNTQIIVSGISTFTNVLGEYLLEEVPTGTHYIEALATGFQPNQISNTTINFNETTYLNITLTPGATDKGTLIGYIKNTEGNPVSAYIYWANGGIFTTLTGKYTLTDITIGDHEITAIADNHESKTDPVEIVGGIITEHNFTLTALSPEQLCGNNELDLGEQCDNDLGPCPGLCTNDCLCPTSCLTAGGDCYSWNYQCSAVDGTTLTIDGVDLCAASNYDDSSYGCCNTTVEQIPPCHNGALNNEPITNTDLTNSSGTMCQCGNQFLDVNNTNQSNGYCCEGIYHQSNDPCIAYGTFTGYVTEEINITGIEAVTLSFTLTETTQTYSTSTIYNGNYLIQAPSGQYSLLVSKPGYSYATTTLNILPSELQSNNFTLTPIYVECSETSLAEPFISANQSRGIKDLTLNWQQPCPDQVDRFEIYRNGEHIHTTLNTQFTYIDTTVEWNTSYEYHILAYSNYGITSTSNLITMDIGSSDCEGKFYDESWCMEETKRVVCDATNKPVLWDGIMRNSPNGDCITAQGNNSLCQQAEDETWCTDAQANCPGTGLGQGNIFGLYYDAYYEMNQLGCLEDKTQPEQLQQRYCYYDSYQDFWTSVDRCLNCDTDMSCYDYKTEQACLEDNCYAGDRNNLDCKWYDSTDYFGRLGKGICYAEDYQGTDYCNLCGPQGDVFENTACTHDVCSKLGKCYSDTNQTTCISCATETTCESYISREDCVGESLIEFGNPQSSCGSSENLTFSQDNCKLGRCKWDNNKCIKDGDADNIEDCEADQTCLKDNTAPNTLISNKPSYINHAGYTLVFSPLDYSGANKTYYCIGETCCPNTEVENNNILLSGETSGLINKEELITLRYYSLDNANNIEQIKSTEIYTDTIVPDMEIIYTLSNSTSSESASDLTINISVTENALCHDYLVPAESTKLTNTLIEIDAPHQVTYPTLQDSNYLYTLTCTDLHQNSKTKNWTIEVDRVQMIFDESPNLETISGNSVNISIKTKGDQYYCYYNQKGKILKYPFNPSQGAQGIPDNSDYYYEAIVEDLESDTYIYEVKCYDAPNGNLKDTSTITFTIDNLPPISSISAISPNGSIIEMGERPYKQLFFQFQCEDQPQGPPQESGCTKIEYCTAAQPCTPYIVHSGEYMDPFTNSGTYYLCYRGTDLFNNIEETNCNQLIIDNSPPVLSITSPIDMSLSSSKIQAVMGLWNDTSEVSIFIKAVDKNGITSESVQANTSTKNNLGQFTANIELFGGYNQLIATAYDLVGNSFSTSITSYLDSFGPTISEFNSYDNYGNTNHQSDTIKSLEYGQTWIFELKANDELWGDPNDETLDDVGTTTITLECISGTGCTSSPVTIALQANESFESFITSTHSYIATYDPSITTPLDPGSYSLTLNTQDQFGSTTTLQQTIEVQDTTEFAPEIYNHQNQRIDQLSKKAEFSYPINFNFISNKQTILDEISLTISNTVPSIYSSTAQMQHINNSFTFTLEDDITIGNYTVDYEIKDLFGKTYQFSQEFIVEDTTEPSFTITIKKDNITVDSVGYGIYNAIIHASEPLLQIDHFNYSFGSNKAAVTDITGSAQTWQGNLYIAPTAMYANLDHTTATFKIQAQDLNQLVGDQITNGSTFTINTEGPDAPEIFDPTQELTYTNQPQIYITGADKDWQPNRNILLRKNIASPNPLDPGWDISAQTQTSQSNPSIASWESSIYGEIIPDTLTSIIINDYSHLFAVGKFLEFSNTKQYNHKYYEITHIELYSDPEGVDELYTITFQPPLEENLSQTSQNINIYNTQIPSGWFEYNLPLDQWANHLAAQGLDESGNYGTYSEVFTVIYDTQPPEFNQLTPSPLSYTNEEKPLIEATVTDLHGSINRDTITLTIGNLTVNCTSATCASNEEGSEITISYLPSTNLETGWTNLTISATDKAGNTASLDWAFLMDGLSPTPPSIQLIPGNKILEGSPYTYYSNHTTPTIGITFSPFELIEVTNIELEKGTQQINDPFTLTTLSNYQFSATPNNQFQEESYTLKIYATKQFPNGSWSEEAYWQYPFTIDITPPTLNAAIPARTNNQITILNLSYTEINPYYINITGDVTPTQIDYTELYTPFQTIIELTEEIGIKNINLTISDKAGNIAQTSVITEMDNIAPTVSDDYQNNNIWVSTPQTATISAQDPNGIKELKYCLVTGCYPLIDGILVSNPYTHTFTQDQMTIMSYQASDNFDNPSDIGSFSVLIDTTPPNLTISTYNQRVNHPTITVSGEYSDLNIANITFTGDVTTTTFYPQINQGIFVQQLTLTPEEGEKIITATATDQIGHTTTRTITVYLDFSSSEISIDDIENAIKVDDHYILDSSTLTILGSYLLTEDIEIYSASRTSNKATLNNGQFTINITSLDGYSGSNNTETNNTITLIAEDATGNKFNASVLVIKDHSPPTIKVTNPATLSTRDPTPLIEITTHEPATCSLEYLIGEGNYRYLDFTTTDSRIHQTQITDFLEENEYTIMATTCTDLLDHNITKPFLIKVDTIPPTISYVNVYNAELQELTTSHASFLLFLSDSTNLEAFSPEPIRCKYGQTPDYDSMEKFPNFDELEFSSQRYSNTFQLDNGFHTLYLGCEDMAGNLANIFQIDVEVNTELPIQIKNINPQGYTNIQYPDITFETYRNASCTIDVNPQQGEYISRVYDLDSHTYGTSDSLASKTHTGATYLHSAKVSGPSDSPQQLTEIEENKTFSFTINCDAVELNVNPSEPHTFNFTTDFTIPFINLIHPLDGFITNETVLQISGTTEPLANFQIYVNDEQQLYPIHTIDGDFSTVAILANGSNKIELKIEDKATNTNQQTIYGVYNNIGTKTELIDPFNGDIINPITTISTKLLQENNFTPSPQLTEFIIYTLNNTQEQLLDPGTITTTANQATLNFAYPYEPLPINKYRIYVVPITADGVRGEGQNSLFEIKDPIPEIFLSSPYTSTPYKYLVVTTPEIEFAGLITGQLLSAQFYLNGQQKTIFSTEEFSTTTPLIEGHNRFAIMATSTNQETGIKHGEVILDSTGPDSTIIIE